MAADNVRASWVGMILGVNGPVASRDYMLWWSRVKHLSSSPITDTHREAHEQSARGFWTRRDEMGHWPCKHAPPPLHPCKKLSSLYMDFMARDRHEVHRILDLAQFFHQSDSARDVSIRENPTCWKPWEPFHWFNLTLQSPSRSTRKMAQNTWVSFGVASSTCEPRCHRFSSNHPVGKGGKRAKCAFHFFPPWFLFMLDLQRVTATATLLTEAAIHGSSAKKGSFEFCYKEFTTWCMKVQFNTHFDLLYSSIRCVQV